MAQSLPLYWKIKENRCSIYSCFVTIWVWLVSQLLPVLQPTLLRMGIFGNDNFKNHRLTFRDKISLTARQLCKQRQSPRSISG